MSDKRIDFVVEKISDWESGLNQFFGLWNEYAQNYQMQYSDGDPRPMGISKNVSAETPRAVNVIASTMTRMQTAADPPFELRSDTMPEENLYDMEKKVLKNLEVFEFKRNLFKGNRGLCLFGTQVFEKPYMTAGYGLNKTFEGTAFRPVSLLQMAFDPNVYSIEDSDHMSPVLEMTDYQLLNLANGNGEIWDLALIEKAIAEGLMDTEGLTSKSQRDQRRIKAGYLDIKSKRHQLVLYNGRVSKDVIETPEFQEMWVKKYGRSDDPRMSDITMGILDRKYIIRFHPTPYGTWHHWYEVGHYVETELQPLGIGIGAMGKDIQKDMNRILRYCSNVAKFSLFNMFLAGRGSGLKSGNMNVIPWSALQVDDVKQIKELRPQVDGIGAGLKLFEILRDDFRGVSNATDTLQAVISGATASETTLAQGSAMRSVGLTAEVEVDQVIRPYGQTLIINMIDQNPYDTKLVKDVDIQWKSTTDKDYRPEHAKMLMEFANLVTSIRNNVPLDLNPAPIYDYLARAAGINPRRLREPRNQNDKLLDVLKRLQGVNGGANEAAGEAAGAGQPGVNIAQPLPEVPTNPNPSLGVV